MLEEEKINEQPDVIADPEVIPESTPAPEPESVDLSEDLMRQAYAKAEVDGKDPDVLDTMGEDGIREFLSEKKPVPADTAEAPATRTAAPEKETAPVENPEVLVERERYKNLESVKGKIADELGKARQEVANLRQAFQQFQPVIEAIQDPEVQQYLLSRNQSARIDMGQPPGLPVDYDPYNPAHIQMMIQKGVQEHLANQQRIQTEQTKRQSAANMLSNFASNLNSEQQRLIASGEDPVLVQTAVKELSGLLYEGKFADAAVKLKKIDKMVADAEQRGRAAAQLEFSKQMDKAANMPIRIAGAGARSTTNNNDGIPASHSECETADQLMSYMDRLTEGSVRYKAAYEYGLMNFPESFDVSTTKNW